MPLVSVILPAHDVAPWIEESVGSALGQTLADLEVIAVDDGSTDGTDERLARLQASSKAAGRLVVLRQARAGAAAARNTALARARGRYVGFLDADDRWHPENLERKVSVLEADPDADLCLSGYRTIDAAGRATGWAFQPAAPSLLPSDLLLENPIGCGSVVVARRSAVEAAGRFDESLPANVDIDLWLRIAARRPECLRYVPEVLADYRRRPGQITGDWREMARSRERVLEKMRDAAPEELARVERRAGARYRLYLAELALRTEDFAGARGLVARAWGSPREVARTGRGWKLSALALASLLPRRWHAALLGAWRERRRRRAGVEAGREEAPPVPAAAPRPARARGA